MDERERRQAELQQLEREIVEAAYLRRTNGLETVRDAVRRLGELGSPSGVLGRAPQEFGLNSQFDRILLSEVTPGQLTPIALWEREADHELPAFTVALDYPLVEYEICRGRRTELVNVADVGARSPQALTDAFGWTSYVVAPVVVEDEVVGTLHADASASARVLDEVDCELLALACTGLGEVFGRAVLRQSLQRHRSELQAAMAWLTGQLRQASRPRALDASGAQLTAREREILGLMARGQTNAQIATALAVREGTVKYHVKNVLRKLGARSRADAVARYARLG